MKTSPSGRKLIESFEGLRLTSYRDQRGVLTIGYGHTGDVYENETITQSDADNLLAIDLHRAETVIYTNLQDILLTQNQFDALVSLIYNIGGHAFETSTVLKRIEAEDFYGAATAFLMWNKTNGQVNKGLDKRRHAEAQLFMTSEPSC